MHAEDRRHVEFMAGADILIHDSQYTDAEYPVKRGWGHTTIEWSVDYALAAGVKKLVLYHHEPTRNDDGVDLVLAQAQQRAGAALEVIAAAEGQVIELQEQTAETEPLVSVIPASPVTLLAQLPPEGPIDTATPLTVLIADDDPGIRVLLRTILRNEGLRLLEARDGEEALQLTLRERPDLLLLDWQMPERDGLSVCRLLRADADTFFQRVPIVLITAQAGPREHHCRLRGPPTTTSPSRSRRRRCGLACVHGCCGPAVPPATGGL